jgi:hypothetical protein
MATKYPERSRVFFVFQLFQTWGKSLIVLRTPAVIPKKVTIFLILNVSYFITKTWTEAKRKALPASLILIFAFPPNPGLYKEIFFEVDATAAI